MKLLQVLTIPVLISGLGCQRLLDWNSGTDKISCTYTQTVGTKVNNGANRSVTVNFCSPVYTLKSPPQTLDPANSPLDFSETVRSDTQDTSGMSGDNCQDRGVTANQVGSAVPQLSAADLATLKLCYTPAPSYAQYLDQYSIVAIGDTCPAGSAVFDQSTVACKH